MSSATELHWDFEQFPRRWMGLFRSDDRPVIEFVHELLELAAAGHAIHVQVSTSGNQIAVEIAALLIAEHSDQPTRSLSLPLPRPGIVVRSMCARLAKIGRRTDRTVPDPYGDTIVIPLALIESGQTRIEADPWSDDFTGPINPFIKVAYSNHTGQLLQITMTPGDQ